MRRHLLPVLCLSALCAGAAGPSRFDLFRSGPGDGPAGVFSLDESAVRLACVEEDPLRPAEGGTFVAVLCHGLGARKESPLFDAVSKALRERGIAVARFDFNGHGESDGEFSRMAVSNEVLDVETVVDHYRNVRGARVALVGHSQGGVVAALAASRLGADSVEALALLAPAGVLREDAQRGRIFDAVFDPLDPPAEIPIMGGRLVLGRDYVLDAQRTDPYAAVAAYGGPLAVVHGQGDTVVPWSCGQRFVDAHAGAGDLVLLRSAGHDFAQWEDTVAEVVADFLAKVAGPSHAEDAEEEVHAEFAEDAEEAAHAASAEDAEEEVHAESAEDAEEESHAEFAESAEDAEPSDAEDGLEFDEEEPSQEMPVELPPDIRSDMESFLHILDMQAGAEGEPVVEFAEIVDSVPAEEEHAESAEIAEPVPAEEEHAESAEIAAPDSAVEVPDEEDSAEFTEGAESALPEGGSGEAEPPPVETHAESAESAEPGPAEKPHAEPVESAEGGEAATPESTASGSAAAVDSPQVPAAEPPAVDSPKSVDSIQSLAEAYPSLPIAPNGSVINILAAPNGLTWQGLEVEEEDMIDRLRIFGASIPDAYVRIQAFPETPFERVRTLAVAAKDAGFSRISVVLPSAR